MRVCCPYCDGACTSCEWCNETGLCCPVCRGAGFQAKWRKGLGSIMMRCPTCHVEMADGWQFDGRNAMRAIGRYLEDWFVGIAIDEKLTRQKEDERARKEMEAYRAQQPRRGVWKHG
jgi:hypothetical protein